MKAKDLKAMKQANKLESLKKLINNDNSTPESVRANTCTHKLSKLYIIVEKHRL